MNRKNNFVFEIITNLSCNMNCKYCFERKLLENMDKKEIKNYSQLQIDFIKKLLNDENSFINKEYDGINLSFFGGECTLFPERLLPFFEQLYDIDKIGEFFIVSNGYHFSKKIKEAILKYKDKMYIQISFDGKPIHDKYRIDKKDRPTSDKILKTIDWLKENNIRFTINSVITPNDFEYLYETYLYMSDLYKKYNLNIQYTPKLDFLYKNFNLKERKEVLEYQLKQIIKHLKSNNKQDFGWFRNRVKALCSVGNHLLGLYENKVIPCHGFIYNEDFLTGIHNICDFEKYRNCLKKLNKFRNEIKEKVYKKEPIHCKMCNSNICFRCPSITYGQSKKEDYFEKMIDYLNNDVNIFYKIIGFYSEIYKKI